MTLRPTLVADAALALAALTRMEPALIRDVTLEEAAQGDALLVEAIEALKALLQFNEDLCADIGVSKHYPSAEKARAVLLRATQAKATA